MIYEWDEAKGRGNFVKHRLNSQTPSRC